MCDRKYVLISLITLLHTLPSTLSQNPGVVDVDYSCELKWVAEGFGNVPDYAVSPSPGEFIAKVNLLENNKWRVGRLLPHDGKTLVAFAVPPSGDDNEYLVFESDTYEVLTNPDNCVLQWVPAFGGAVPKYPIPADDKTLEFVGRSIVAGFSMAGNLIPSESALFVPYDGKVYPRRNYDVLTSQYPRLNMELSNFIFPILDFRVLESRSKEVLIGQMEILSSMDASNPTAHNNDVTVVQPITHSKNLKEIFKFQERYEWEGVSNLTVEMDLWIGSPTVQAIFNNLEDLKVMKNGPHFPLLHKRERPIDIDRTVTISGSGGASGQFQVCSAVTVLENFGVKFEALAVVTAPGMRSDQVKEILLRTGRNILDVDDSEDTVLARIYGTLRGSFITGTSSVYSPVDAHGACNSVLKKSKHAHTHTNFHPF